MRWIGFPIRLLVVAPIVLFLAGLDIIFAPHELRDDVGFLWKCVLYGKREDTGWPD